MAQNEVELVRPEDMCIGPYRRGECGCIAFWRNTLITYGVLWCGHVLAMKRLFGKTITSLADVGSVTQKDAADMFNMALHEIGFTVGNPPLSKKRIAELRRKMVGR